MKKILLFLFLPLLFVACGKETAQQTAAGYLESIRTADWSRACSFVDDKSKEAIQKATRQDCEDYLKNNQDATRFQGPYRPISIQRRGSWGEGSSGWGPFYMKRSSGTWKISWLPPQWLLDGT